MDNAQVSQVSQVYQDIQDIQDPEDHEYIQASQYIQTDPEDTEDIQEYQEYLAYQEQMRIYVHQMRIKIHNRVGNFPIVPSPAGSHGLYITIYADTPNQRTISCTVPMYEFDKYEMMDIESKELIGAFDSIESMCTALLHIIV